jgi:hypothetical protein
MKNKFYICLVLAGAMLLARPCTLQAQLFFTNGFYFSTNDGSACIVDYSYEANNPGFMGVVSIPGTVVVNGIALPVTSIGEGAFADYAGFNYIGGLLIPNSITNIGNNAFAGCEYLTNIMIGNSVINIGYSAFEECLSLDNVVIPNSVNSIGAGAFMSCIRLTNIAIGSGVTNIGICVFEGCWQLQTITVDASNPVYSGVGGVLFDKNQTALIEFPGATGSYSVPDTVTSIYPCAFDYCEHLTNITIGSSVTSIGSYAFVDGNNSPRLYFCGNAPSADATIFTDDSNGTVYYLPGTSGWTTNYYGLPTALWFLPNPLILASQPSFGVQSNQFGLTISWATNAAVVVEACTNLSNPAWQPVQTNSLTGGTAYFSDPQWANYPGRFYRLISP